MNKKGNMTREQAVAAVGEESVAKVDKENCEYTNRLLDNGQTEFRASIRCYDTDNNPVTLSAYYYQEDGDVRATEELDNLDWTVNGYEVV